MPGLSAKRLAPTRGNEAIVSRKNPRFEIVEPVRQPKDLVTYRKAGPGVMDPVQNAENQLMFLEDEYLGWLNKDCENLCQSWRALVVDPSNCEKFIDFHKAVHTVSGNAAILKCPNASSVAKPLARMLERRPNIEHHIKLVESAVLAICAATRGGSDQDDPRMNEIIQGLDQIVNRWIERRQ